ncbi:AAA family ATPase, partial [Neobacillus drentensis]|uniref:AAA family ATPase n=1 Tax=Neobacillus drentensis TaxID=220684 RepID=UPI0030033973
QNNKEISYRDLLLPRKIIASAFSPYDRFTFKKPELEEEHPYEYLGIKSASNAVMLGTTSKNLIYNILYTSLKNDFLTYLKAIFDFLNLDPHLRIKFRAKKREEATTYDFLVKLQQNLEKRKRIAPKIDIDDILEFFKRNTSEIQRDDTSLTIDLDLLNPAKYDEYVEDFMTVLHLYEIGYFREPQILIKKGTYFPLKEASSGEQHYLTMMINILSKIEPQSLVLIDEPETSLHPNWQYRYLYNLKEMFKAFDSCHFILATHSHFLISDLEPESSSFVSLHRDRDKQIKATLHDEKTFGWSVEDVLYNVFKVPSFRNYYLAEELDTILLAISTGEISQEIREKIEKVRTAYHNMKESDPLKDLIELLIEGDM